MDFESLFDIPIDDLHTPCYLTDARLLQKNTALLKQIQQRTGCKILLAQKAFSMFSAYPLIRDDLAGTTASGLFEAKLGREHFGKEVHVFSPAYTPVSYTHLDVYKRQALRCTTCSGTNTAFRSSSATSAISLPLSLPEIGRWRSNG